MCGRVTTHAGRISHAESRYKFISCLQAPLQAIGNENNNRMSHGKITIMETCDFSIACANSVPILFSKYLTIPLSVFKPFSYIYLKDMDVGRSKITYRTPLLLT